MNTILIVHLYCFEIFNNIKILINEDKLKLSELSISPSSDATTTLLASDDEVVHNIINGDDGVINRNRDNLRTIIDRLNLEDLSDPNKRSKIDNLKNIIK